MTTLAIINAHAGAGKTRICWQVLEPLASELFPDLTVVITTSPADIEDACRNAFAAEGDHLLMAVGGDGTNHYVVNTLMQLRQSLPHLERVAFTCLPLGTGNDFVSGVSDMPVGDGEASLRWLVNRPPRPLDLMTVHYNDISRYGVNVTSMGLGYDVNERVNRAVGKSQRTFLLATIQSIVHYQPPPLTVTVDGNIWYQGDVYVLAAGNGSQFGAGMRIAPHARADDGQLAVTLIEGYNRLNILNALSKVYSGNHIKLPKVQTTTGKQITIHAPETGIGIDIDGETDMTDQLTIEVFAGALLVRL